MNAAVDGRSAGRAKWREHWLLPVAAVTIAAFGLFGQAMLSALGNPAVLAVVFAWLFLTIIGMSISVVRHAERLAGLLGEPYGTLILTLSVTIIEVVSVTAVMMHGEANPTMVRDTLSSVLMIILNGMVGLSLLFGAWRNRELLFNLQGATTYLGVIVPLVTFVLILPNFTQTTAPGTLSTLQQVVLGIVSVGLYGVFLFIQARRHREYFQDADGQPVVAQTAEPKRSVGRQVAAEVALLLVYLLPVLFLVEQFATPIDYVVETLGAPTALSGLIVAVLVACPEALGAVRAAMANQLQRAMNIFLGSVLSTIGLTVPIMLLVAQVVGQPLVLGLEHGDLILMVLTLALAVITFSNGRTNLLQGAVHLLLFVAYVLLLFEN